MAQKLLHKRSNVADKVPTTGACEVGEILINYNASSPMLSTRKSDNTVATFRDSVYYDNLLEKAVNYKGLTNGLPATTVKIGDLYKASNAFDLSGSTSPKSGDTTDYSCSFGASNTWSNHNIYSVTGKTATATTVSIDGHAYNYALKQESNTTVTFSFSGEDKTLYIYSESPACINLDGTKISSDTNELKQNIKAGSHTITKGTTVKIYYIDLLSDGDESTSKSYESYVEVGDYIIARTSGNTGSAATWDIIEKNVTLAASVTSDLGIGYVVASSGIKSISTEDSVKLADVLTGVTYATATTGSVTLSNHNAAIKVGNLTITSNGTSVGTYNGLTSVTAATTDQKVADTSSNSKAYLLGHATQGTTATTYSNSAVYMSGGTLNATEVQVNEKAKMVYNSTEECIDFIFK